MGRTDDQLDKEAHPTLAAPAPAGKDAQKRSVHILT